MPSASPNGFIISVEQIPASGMPWVVRVYRKVLFFRKRVSSDWFLNELQARTYAEQIAEHLGGGAEVAFLKTRQPGWVFHRPPH
jgi:hypothetical protein